MASCSHCGAPVSGFQGNEGFIIWCTSCVNEESNLLNSLGLTAAGHQYHYPDDPYHSDLKGTGRAWCDIPQFAALKNLPKKGNQ